MPEDDEKQETEEFKKNINTEPDKKRYKRIKTPKELAVFLTKMEPGYAWLDGLEVKKKFPNLKMSAKKINEFMGTQEYRDERLEQIPQVTKNDSVGMFNLLRLRYFKGQMELDIPHYKALVFFGQISGEYDPVAGVKVYDGDRMDKEREKKVVEEAVRAYINKIEREMKEKEGNSNGE